MRQIKLIIRLTLLLLINHLIIACDVKEERDVCPCLLSIDLSQCINKRLNKTLALSIDGEHISETINIKLASKTNNIVKKVPKELLFITAFSNKIKHSELKKDHIEIPTGNQADSIFYHAKYINADREKINEKIYLKQGFVKLIIESKYKEDDFFPFEIEICSNTNGYNIITSEPTFGKFLYTPTSDENNNFSCVIPRQGDNSLVINIYDFLTKSNNRHLLKSIELGKILEKQEYDWHAAVPEDIHVMIDLNMPTFSIEVNDWDSETYEDIKI